jgi:hypothetical protein
MPALLAERMSLQILVSAEVDCRSCTIECETAIATAW